MRNDRKKQFFLLNLAVAIAWSIVAPLSVSAQLVDEIIGQKRSKVQAQLKQYRIIDYKQDREVHSVEPGIHQTLLFENDTCRRFYWTVVPSSLDRFDNLMIDNGYQRVEEGFTKDGIRVLARELESGSATLYIVSAEKKVSRDIRVASASLDKESRKKGLPTEAELQTLPLLQRTILEEAERDTADAALPKRLKDPKKHWVGDSFGQTRILGW